MNGDTTVLFVSLAFVRENLGDAPNYEQYYREYFYSLWFFTILMDFAVEIYWKNVFSFRIYHIYAFKGMSWTSLISMRWKYVRAWVIFTCRFYFPFSHYYCIQMSVCYVEEVTVVRILLLAFILLLNFVFDSIIV